MCVRSNVSGMSFLCGLRAPVESLPKPGCRHPGSAPKPDVNVSVHPAPQHLGGCHPYRIGSVDALLKR